MEAATEIRSLSQLGYKGPIVTQGLRGVDEVLYRIRQDMHSGKLLGYIAGLVDNLLARGMYEIMADGNSCFCAACIVLGRGRELLVLVPWPAQYDEGACSVLYKKGHISEVEMDRLMIYLINLIEFGEQKAEWKYLM